jgi:hypothetical protein
MLALLPLSLARSDEIFEEKADTLYLSGNYD